MIDRGVNTDYTLIRFTKLLNNMIKNSYGIWQAIGEILYQAILQRIYDTAFFALRYKASAMLKILAAGTHCME